MQLISKRCRTCCDSLTHTNTREPPAGTRRSLAEQEAEIAAEPLGGTSAPASRERLRTLEEATAMLPLALILSFKIFNHGFLPLLLNIH